MGANFKRFFLVLLFFAAFCHGRANAIELGQPALPFELPALQTNQTNTLKQFAGKVLYLDFWASWCAPCRVSFPLMAKLHQKLQARGFEIVAVNLDEDPVKAHNFLKEYPVPFTVLKNTDGRLADNYGVESMPTSFIIDQQGIVQYVHNGFSADDINLLEEKIVRLLDKK